MKDWTAWFKAVAAGTVSGAAVGLIAFLFLSSAQFPGMGATLFLAVPIAAGFSVALVAQKPYWAGTAALLAVIFSLAMLIAFGAEGLLCALLSLPIIGVGLGLGLVLGLAVRKQFVNRSQNRNTTMGMLLLFAPILVVASERIETPMLQFPRTEVIQSSIEVRDSPVHVWSNILSIDNVTASKPFLMYVGLPIPQRCITHGQGVGAKRTCYFNAGYIEESVTVWNPPYYLGLSIDRTHMPGRHWLGFESADYRLESRGDITLLTRRTTVTSHLHPTFYWRAFERFGVESEHNYILQDVQQRAQH